MTTTPTVQVSNAWQTFADSAASDTAVTIQNYDGMHLCVAIDGSEPAATDQGIYIDPRDRETFAGFDGKLWLRYPSLENGKTKAVGVMKS